MPSPAKRPAWLAPTLAAAGVLVVAGAFFFVSSPPGLPGAGSLDDDSCSRVPASSISHVHGLAVNPEDANELLIATHHGLFSFRVAEERLARIGSTVDDLMGFTVHPSTSGVMWASGHPAERSLTHYNLGVVMSEDGGCSWTRIALEGVDFHTLGVSAVNANHLWGHFGGEVYHSRDGGFTWLVVGNLDVAASFVGHPTDANTLFAVGRDGVLRSPDAGVTWGIVARLDAAAVAFEPRNPDVLYAATRDGVFKSSDGGSKWAGMGLNTGSDRVLYLAADPAHPSRVYAATASSVHASPDGGASWSRIL